MSQNLTQPEEVDCALLEMSRRGLKMEALAKEIGQLYKTDREGNCAMSDNPTHPRHSELQRDLQSLF